VVETVVTRVMEEVQKSITVKEENLKGILHKEIEKMKSEVVFLEKGDETNDQDKKVVEEMAEEVGGRVTSSSPSSPLAALPSLHLLGLPIWWGSNTAQAVLQAGVESGQCWAMEGAQGHLTIALARPLLVTGVSIQHAWPTHNPTSAPRLLRLLAGTTTTNITFPPPSSRRPQTFLLEEAASQLLDTLTLQVEANHGHPDFTCIYRLMVHGQVQAEVQGEEAHSEKVEMHSEEVLVQT